MTDIPRVTIYGGGIAGLTAANELCDRGFQVRVLEERAALDARGNRALAVGGLARSQFARAAKQPPGAALRLERAPMRIGDHSLTAEPPSAEFAILPGEHGFRFFPSTYRHVFDSMKRIPLYDERGMDTGRTVYDNLVSVPTMVVASPEHAPALVRRTRSSGFNDVADELRFFENTLGYERRDLQQITLRLLRYLTSCSARRAAECEDISWWSFLRGWDPGRKRHRFSYGSRITEDIKVAPRILVAFDVEHGDARTCGNMLAQLLLDRFVEHDLLDAALNGPTTEAWFDPWKAHLERIGVQFLEGRLERFELGPDGRITGWVTWPGGTEPTRDDEADYYLVATDVITAERVTEALPKIGVPGDLQGYTTSVGPNDVMPKRRRDPRREVGLSPQDRLQTLSGIQYFFTCDVKLVTGRLYMPRSEWALSSVTSHQFWRVRPSPHRDGFAAVLSVDIGAFRRPAERGALSGRTAWECTASEMAAEVWRQTNEALTGWWRAFGVSPERALPSPSYCVIDEALVFDPPEGGKLVENRAPYLVPIAGDWKNRPGPEPWDPTWPDATERRAPVSDHLWQAAHGGYAVHWNQLVFAGTYLRTFTRITTMESANESARHAVNAILDHYLERIVPTSEAQAPTTADSQHQRRTLRAVASSLCRPSPLGDYCRIWNPECHELPDLVSLKEEDEERFASGRPHLWDAWQVETVADLVGRLTGTNDDPGTLLDLLTLGATLLGEPAAAAHAPAGLKALRRLRERLEAEVDSRFRG